MDKGLADTAILFGNAAPPFSRPPRGILHGYVRSSMTVEGKVKHREKQDRFSSVKTRPKRCPMALGWPGSDRATVLTHRVEAAPGERARDQTELA
ncbi:MAG: hypothetical protein ACREQQ_15155, partial [Candidatus Binatia bacterium]